VLNPGWALTTRYYDPALNKKDFAAAFRHLGDRYIRHNPNAADGLSAGRGQDR
jgi:predicted SnoaL-like aldol condensation-catalyzing enzyme